MSVPQPVRAQVLAVTNRTNRYGFTPLGDEYKLILQAAKGDPSSVRVFVDVLVKHLNQGRIGAGDVYAAIGWLDDLAGIAEDLRSQIAEQLEPGLLDYYIHGDEERHANLASKLAETLAIERPRHYFDLCREILVHNGSIFVIGAGFSYDSYAPLLREMEGIACASLDILGEADPHHLYRRDDRVAWEKIAAGWQTFQRIAAHILCPKEPAEQHHILAELFRNNHVRHIVSFNWDDLIEKAYRTRYGEEIPKVAHDGEDNEHALWKLHGDIADPDERWVLPYEEGQVFTPLADQCAGTMMRVFVIGYREQEPRIREKLIEPLERRVGVTRIRPDIETRPPDAIADTASAAMKKVRFGLEAVSR